MDQQAHGEPARQQAAELRLALAMRGGVSLAVWMGGACREIERLRRSSPQAHSTSGDADHKGDQDGIYRTLLEKAGYRHVVLDVLAGTSAGGLNAVLLGCSVVYDMRFADEIRNLWLQVADIEQLSRPTWQSTPPSVLRGTDGFYRALLSALQKSLPEARLAAADRAAQRLDLILTCTLLDSEQEAFYQQIGRPINEARSWGRFRFRHFGAEPAASDFRGPSGDHVEAVRRLAYAARSTSSYPGAFEPAEIRVGPEDDGVGAPVSDMPLPRSMHGVFSESRPEQGNVCRLIDGGVLDNIPVAWAIRSIAAASAYRKVDRWLLYLQPVPPQEQAAATPAPGPAGRAGSVPRLVAIARKALAIKLSSESLLEDVSELRRYASAAQQRRQLAEALATMPLTAKVLGTLAASGDALDAYRHRQGDLEAARLTRLLQEPVEVTGPDPLPFDGLQESLVASDIARFLSQLAGDRRGDDLQDLALPGGLGQPFPAATGAGTALPDILSGNLRSLHGLARTIATLLDWAARLEEIGPGAGAIAQETLYPLRSAVEFLIAGQDRMLLRRCATLREQDTAVGVMRDAANAVWTLAEEVQLLDRAKDPAALKRFCEGLTAPPPAGSPKPSRDWPKGCWSPLWAALADAAGRLREVALQLNTAPSGACYQYLKEAASGADMLRSLVALEVLFGPLRPDPLSETADIQFQMVSAANDTPFSGAVFGRSQVSVDDKLAGNQLNNFAAFLSARWRHGDWVWGRLDGARSLVELLTRPERMDEGSLQDVVRGLRDKPPLIDDFRPPCVEVDPGQLSREQLVEEVVFRLHEGILSDELPVLRSLRDDPSQRRDAAPTAPVGREELAALGRIGQESLGLPALRRPLGRVGLVLWQALKPSGQNVGARFARVLLALVKPLMIPVLVNMLAAPLTLLATAALWLVATTRVARDGWTWGHLLLVLTAWGSVAWSTYRFGSSTARRQNPGASTAAKATLPLRVGRWLWAWGPTVLAGVLLLAVVPAVAVGREDDLARRAAELPFWAAPALAAAGALAAVLWVRKGWRLWLVVVAAAFLVAWSFSAWFSASSWTPLTVSFLKWRPAIEVGLLFVYTELAVLAAALTFCYPVPQTPDATGRQPSSESTSSKVAR